MRWSMAAIVVLLLFSCGLAMFICSQPAEVDAQAKPAPLLEGAVDGDPKLTRFEAITFGANGTLFLGDGNSRRIVAVETGDTEKAKSADFKRIDDLLGAISEKLGGRNVVIGDLAVNPASGKAYVAIRAGELSLLVTITGDGAISEFKLNKVKYAEIKLPLDKGVKAIAFNDLAVLGDKLVATACTADAFLAKIYVANAPLKHGVSASLISAETYHRSHGAWETAAPIERMALCKRDGKTWLVGGYMCTPVARFCLDDAKQGQKLRGITPFDFGPGKQPRDMLFYEKEGKASLITAIDDWDGVRVVRIKQELLFESDKAKLNEKAPCLFDDDNKAIKATADKFEELEKFAGLGRIDRFDEKRALVIRAAGDKFVLEALELP